MVLLARPLVTQLARDVIAVWLRRSTGLVIAPGDSNEPRPALPYAGFTFPRGRPSTGYQRALELIETLGETTITITAAEEERAAALLGPALVELVRGVGETLEDFTDRFGVEAAWWLRGRCEVGSAGDTVTVTPLAPGLLVAAQAVEGLTLTSAVGDPTCRVERLYRATCRVEIAGAPPGAVTGTAGDGLDTYSIEAAIREGLTDPETKRILRGGWLVPTASPAEVPFYASAVSGARRESRVNFDLTFGWSGLFVRDPTGITSLDFTLGLAAEGLDTASGDLEFP